MGFGMSMQMFVSAEEGEEGKICSKRVANYPLWALIGEWFGR